MRSLVFALLMTLAMLARADDPAFEITIKDHKFIPSEVVVPAGQKIRLIVKNDDATAEEFDSKPLNREKVIAGNSRATIFVGPLKPGEYQFVGEYHESTAIGKLIAK